jgi:hypothetical protein
MPQTRQRPARDGLKIQNPASAFLKKTRYPQRILRLQNPDMAVEDFKVRAQTVSRLPTNSQMQR